MITYALLWIAASIAWPFIYYRAIDPLLRGALGRTVGAVVVWRCDARQFFITGRYRRWHWSIADAPPDYVTWREGVVNGACAIAVNVIAGLLTPAALFLSLDAFGIAAYPLLFLAIPIYAFFWSGKWPPPAGRERA